MSFDDLIKDGPPLQRRRSSGKKNRNKGKKKKRRLMRSNSRTRLTEFLETQEDASDSEKEEEESEPDLKQTLSIFWDVLHNRNLQIWFIYNFSCKAANSINANVASVYLTNDLGFPKETLSMIQVVCTPLNIMFAVVSGYLASTKPFAIQSWTLLIGIIVNSYGVLVLLTTFPAQEDINMYTTIHVTIVTLIADLVANFEFVTAFGILMKYTDKRISGIHVTVLAAIYNLCEFLHKLYIFKLIDMFGIQYPQVVLLAIALTVWLLFRSTFIGLKDKPAKSWYVSDHVIAKKDNAKKD